MRSTRKQIIKDMKKFGRGDHVVLLGSIEFNDGKVRIPAGTGLIVSSVSPGKVWLEVTDTQLEIWVKPTEIEMYRQHQSRRK